MWAAATFRSSQHLSILFKIRAIPCVSNYLDPAVSLNSQRGRKAMKPWKKSLLTLASLALTSVDYSLVLLKSWWFIILFIFQIASDVGWLGCGPWWVVSQIPDWGAFSSLLSVEPLALYKSMIHFMVHWWCCSFHVFGSFFNLCKQLVVHFSIGLYTRWFILFKKSGPLLYSGIIKTEISVHSNYAGLSCQFLL